MKIKNLRHKKIKAIKIFPPPFSLKFKYFSLGVFFSLVFVFLPLLFVIFLSELPNPNLLRLNQYPQATKIYDRNNRLLYQIYATENRTAIPLSSIPKSLQNATIAIEDKNFYSNAGFDLLAIIRAAVADFKGDSFQGGSTITQQLIKSTLLTPQPTLQRKIKEIVLSIWANSIYKKGEILEMYLNQVPYGGTSWGVEAASQVYFGKKASDLDLAQSAFLAGLPQAPSTYSPYGESPSLWKQRQAEVLKQMVTLGFISKAEKEDAEKEELIFNPPQIPLYAPHFVMYIKDLLVKRYGLAAVEKGGLKVKTSLDLQLQEQVQDVVKEEVQNNNYLNLTNGAALITNPKNGEILAMVGSWDYTDPQGGNVNATLALRQPGSSIKVVTYSAALANGFTPATFLDDSPITFNNPGSESYSPVNYDGKFHGLVSLRKAFANSFNIPAVKTLNKIGVPTMIDLGKKMGITTWNDPGSYGLSLTLGGADIKMLDMASVYGVLANQGKRVEINPILKITDPTGNILEEKGKAKEVQVIDPGIAFIISDILADNLARSEEFGINSPLLLPNHTVSVKTGTSDDKRDNWTIGYTPSYVVAVWVGNNDNSPMSPTLTSGITGAAPIWNRLMTNLLINSKNEKFTMPSDVIAKPCIGRIEYFIKGTENSVNCTYIPPKITPSPTP